MLRPVMAFLLPLAKMPVMTVNAVNADLGNSLVNIGPFFAHSCLTIGKGRWPIHGIMACRSWRITENGR